MRTKSLSLNKEHSSELVFLIIKLSYDDINHINFDSFGRLLKFAFTFLILLIIWVLLFSKTGHWKRKWVSSSTPVLHNLQILYSVFSPIYLHFSISRLWALTLNLVSTLLSSLQRVFWWPVQFVKYGSIVAKDWYLFTSCFYTYNVIKKDISFPFFFFFFLSLK